MTFKIKMRTIIIHIRFNLFPYLSDANALSCMLVFSYLYV